MSNIMYNVRSKNANKLPVPKNRTQAAFGGSVQLNPYTMGSISLDKETLQALTLAEAKVQITIDSGGSNAVLISVRDGKVMGGLDDLTRIAGLRTFVTKEKKQNASSEVQREAILAAYRSAAYLKKQDDTYVQRKLDTSYMVSVRPYIQLLATVSQNIKRVDENYSPVDRDLFYPVLKSYLGRIKNAIAETIVCLVKGDKEKGLLDKILYERKVPSYLRNKLTNKSLVITKDMELGRILFPTEPTKGLSLTVKEWRDCSFTSEQGDMLRNSQAIRKLLQSDEIVLEMTGLTAEQFQNAEDPKVQRVLKTRILVVPPYAEPTRILELLSKPNFRGFGLPQTALDQGRDKLTGLCSVPLRAYCFSVRVAEMIPDYYDRILPAGTVKPVDDKLGNYAKQTLEAVKAGKSLKLFEILRLEENKTALMAWFERECKIIPKGELSKRISNALGNVPCDKDDPVLAVSSITPPKGDFPDFQKEASRIEAEEVVLFRRECLSIVVKEGSKKKAIASSKLQGETKRFLKLIERHHGMPLSHAMETYFRSFVAPEMQVAAVRIAEARFDEFEDYDVGSSIESDSDESDATGNE